MKYLSICSGIEAASVAFGPLGWKPLAFSEIEAFPRAVLQHHYPDTPLHGDFTELKDQPFIVDADLLCGGTPCQSFSVAGLRQSLADDRGNLTLQFVLLADAIDHLRSTAGREPAWILWENVPGVFSTNDNAFGSFLGGLCGRDAAIPEPEGGWPSAGVVDGPTRCAAWRVLDAQHFGLAQRRKRVFVLARGGAGRWAVADALLPIIEGSGWHPAPSRSKGEGTARGFETGPSGSRITDLAPTIDCRAKNGPIQNQLGVGVMEVIPEVTRPLTAAMGTKWNGNGDLESSLIPSVAHTLRGEGFDASEDGTGRGIPLIAADQVIPFDARQIHHPANHSNPKAGDPCHPLRAVANCEPAVAYRVHGENSTAMVGNGVAAVALRGRDGGATAELSEIPSSLRASQGGGDKAHVLAYAIQERAVCENANAGPQGKGWQEGVAFTMEARHHAQSVSSGMQVRRLTPVECERLQGFPDGYTNIPWRGKPESPDGPRYKALGNSWAVPCARWIGERIKAIRL
jgi:DNA (cytosine-5)-methyltransferase 1